MFSVCYYLYFCTTSLQQPPMGYHKSGWRGQIYSKLHFGDIETGCYRGVTVVERLQFVEVPLYIMNFCHFYKGDSLKKFY